MIITKETAQSNHESFDVELWLYSCWLEFSPTDTNQDEMNNESMNVLYITHIYIICFTEAPCIRRSSIKPYIHTHTKQEALKITCASRALIHLHAN